MLTLDRRVCKSQSTQCGQGENKGVLYIVDAHSKRSHCGRDVGVIYLGRSHRLQTLIAFCGPLRRWFQAPVAIWLLVDFDPATYAERIDSAAGPLARGLLDPGLRVNLDGDVHADDFGDERAWELCTHLSAASRIPSTKEKCRRRKVEHGPSVAGFGFEKPLSVLGILEAFPVQLRIADDCVEDAVGRLQCRNPADVG